jgi:peptide/nickel transport system substrate-binding protein
MKYYHVRSWYYEGGPELSNLSKKLVSCSLLLLLTSSVLFAGCLGSEEREVLVVGISSDVDSWYLSKFPDGDGRFVWSQVFETLIRLDTNLSIIPGLAESWYSPDNGLTWIFNLTHGVKFHDGSEFTAEAVLFSYSDLLEAKKWGILAKVNDTQALDDYTVLFNMKVPMALPFYLTHVAWPVMSPNMANEDGSWNGEVIGTGPFVFQSQRNDEEVVLVRNEDYRGEVPSLRKVVFKVIPDSSTRVAALRSGDVDMILKISEYDASMLEDESGIEMQETLSTFTDFLQFNAKTDPYNASVSPFTDRRVREAVAWGVDTQSIVENLLYGKATDAQGRPFSTCMMYSNPDLDLYTRNVTRAKALLEEAGWEMSDDGYYYKNDSRLSTTLLTSSVDAWAPRLSEMADAIAAQLSEVGMKVTVEKIPTATLSDRETSGDFGMILRTGYFVWGPYPRHFLLHDSLGTWSHYNNSTYDQMERAADSTSNVTLQQELYYQLQEFVLQELPAFYIDHEHKIVAHRDYVKGYQITAEDPWLNLEGIYLEGK